MAKDALKTPPFSSMSVLQIITFLFKELENWFELIILAFAIRNLIKFKFKIFEPKDILAYFQRHLIPKF